MGAVQELLLWGSYLLPEVFAIRITGDTKDIWVEKIILELSLMNGGASVTHSIGTWPNGDSLGEEPSILIEVNCVSAEKSFKAIANIVHAWMKDCKQEAVWLRFNEAVIIAPVKSISAFVSTRR